MDFYSLGLEYIDDFILEFDAPGMTTSEEDNEDEEFSMDDEGTEDTEETPTEETPEDAPADDAPEDEEYSMDDAEQPTDDTTSEQPPEEDAPEDEEYEIPDEDGTEGGEGNPTDAPPDDAPEDEEYSMDGDSSGGDTDTDTSMNDDQMDGDNTDDSVTSAKLRDLESVVFDDLSEAEKKIKIKDLKELYIMVYKKCGSISEMLTDIKKDEETIQIIEYISNTLIDLKQYVDDYINNVFDSKTYIENLSQLQKYIMIFNAINKVFEQIKTENEE